MKKEMRTKNKKEEKYSYSSLCKTVCLFGCESTVKITEQGGDHQKPFSRFLLLKKFELITIQITTTTSHLPIELTIDKPINWWVLVVTDDDRRRRRGEVFFRTNKDDHHNITTKDCAGRHTRNDSGFSRLLLLF